MSYSNKGRCAVLLSEYHLRRFYKPEKRAELESLFPQIHFLHPDRMPEQKCLEQLREINPEVLVVGWESYALPEDYPVGDGALKYVCNTCGGIRNLIPRDLIDKGLIVTDWGASISPSVAEGALLLILAANRRLTESFFKIRQLGQWDGSYTQCLLGRTIGLHGFGRVAKALVFLLKPFNVNIISYAPGVPEKDFYEFDVKPVDDLMELFERSHIVVELEALTRETEGIVTADHLRAIGEKGCFVNVARAGIVDEQALYTVAKERKVHFGLDVFHQEPLPPDSPLRSLPNVTITPHSSGPTDDTFHLCGAHAVENLRRWQAGEPLDSVIDSYRFDLMT